MYNFKGKISSWHQHISKKLGQGHVYHCVASPLLCITVCKRLGTEETSCSSLGIGMLSHSCLIQASSCSTVLGLLCRIFLFMMRQMFSMGERSRLQAGHFSTGSFFYAAMMFLNRAVVGLMDRELDLKPEVTQGCGFESRLRQEVHDCSPGAAQSAAHCSKCVHLDGLNAENTFHSV